MITQKLWKTQHLAEFILHLATSEAAEAARLSLQRQPAYKGLAVIAEETRRIAVNIIEAVELHLYGSFENAGNDDVKNEFNMLMLKLSRRAANLALNTAILACKEREHKPVTVFADELRNFSLQLSEIYGNEQKYMDIPTISPKNTVISDTVYLFNATSGKYTWWENAHFIQEIMFYEPAFIQGNRLVIKNEWRDMDMPFIKLGDVPEDPGVVIISNSLDRKKQYAVLAEFNINALTNSYAGVSKVCNSEIPVRECWFASDGRDIIFPDWDKLSNQ